MPKHPETIFDDTDSGPTTDEGAKPAASTGEQPRRGGDRSRLLDWTPFLLVRAAHPRQALLTAVGLGVAAALAGRPARELALVVVTVLVGQTILGWHNDLVDEEVDRAHARTGKPIADGRLDSGTVWFVLCCGVLLVVPLAVSNGVAAGLAYLGSVVVGMLGNVLLRKNVLSFLPWVIAFGLYAYFLSYGGWGGGSHGGPPEIAMVVLAALLGVGVHVLVALWGLVADNEDGWSYLPLKLGLRLGATKLLVITIVYLTIVVAALLYTGSRIGLVR